MKIRKSFLRFPTILIMGLMVGCQENSPQDLDGEFGNKW